METLYIYVVHRSLMALEEDRVEGGGVVKTLVKAGESFARTLILLMIASCTAVGIH